MDNLRKNIATRLIEERGRLGYTKSSICHQLDISSEILRRYELGITGMPAEFLAKLVILGFDCQYILTGTRSSNLGDVEKMQHFQISNIQNVSGIVGGFISNVTQNNITTEKHITKETVKVTPGEAVITEEQKTKLREKVEEIVEWEQQTRKVPKSFAAVWGALNKHCNVTSYHRIALEDFDKALRFLNNWKGRLLSTVSARNNSNEAWRKNRIKAIHVKIKEKNIEDWYRAFLKTKFKAESSTDLDDLQLQSLYLSVTRKKAE